MVKGHDDGKTVNKNKLGTTETDHQMLLPLYTSLLHTVPYSLSSEDIQNDMTKLLQKREATEKTEKLNNNYGHNYKQQNESVFSLYKIL